MHDLPFRRGATRPFDNNQLCQLSRAGPNNSTHETYPLCHCAQVRRVCVSPVRVQCPRRTVSINPLHELLPRDTAYFGSYDSSEIYGRTRCPAIRGSVRVRSRTGTVPNTYACSIMSSAVACTHRHAQCTHVHEPHDSVLANVRAGTLYRTCRARTRLAERSWQSVQRRTGNATRIASLARSVIASMCPQAT